MTKRTIALTLSGAFLYSCENPPPNDIEILCPTAENKIFVVEQNTPAVLDISPPGIGDYSVIIADQPLFGSVEIDSTSGLPVYSAQKNQTSIDLLHFQIANGGCVSSIKNAVIATSSSTLVTTPTRYIDGGKAETLYLPEKLLSGSINFSVQHTTTKGIADLNMQSGQLMYQANLNEFGLDQLTYIIEYEGIVSEHITTNILLNSIELNVPSSLHIIAGETLKIYFDNIVNKDDLSEVRFQILLDDAPAGFTNLDSWELPTLVSDAGAHHLAINVVTPSGQILAVSESEIIIYNSPDLSDTPTASILFIGDSLTASGIFVRATQDLILGAGFNKLDYLGTVIAQDVHFEGYGGNTWQRYYQEISSKSPFVYNETGLDFERYFAEKLEGKSPDFVFIMLGVNDIFNIRDGSYQTIISSFEPIFQTADLFLAELSTALPNAKILVGSIFPPNARPEAFIDDYGEDRRDRYHNVQHAFVIAQEKHFINREAEGIHFVPMWHRVDTLNGYPIDNAVHPNQAGYSEGATNFFNEFIFFADH